MRGYGEVVRELNDAHLGEQVNQVCDQPAIKFFYYLDESVSETILGERFAEPMELLNHSIPRHQVVQASFVTDVLLCEDPLVFCANGDTGAQLPREANGRFSVGANFDARNHRLGV